MPVEAPATLTPVALLRIELDRIDVPVDEVR
jgi:hypothetical protein